MVPLKDFIAGTVGGFAGKVIEYPFDTIKVQMQASGDSSRGPLSCFREVWRKDGLKGLYKVRWEREQTSDRTSAVLCCTALQNTALMYTILHYTVLHCTVLHRTVLFWCARCVWGM